MSKTRLRDPDARSLIDGFGRQITYLRLSVTDRCDLRCSYCMPERMKFLPRADVLTLEELERLVTAFINRGVRKVRISGGEPLVRRDIMVLMERLGDRVKSGQLEELTLTTNGVRLEQYAAQLSHAGVKRINVSLDTIDSDIFERITGRRKLQDVLTGIRAAKDAGMSVKLNTVVLRRENANDISDIVAWAHHEGHDLSLIEIMPMGDIDKDRVDQYYPLTDMKLLLESRWTLRAETYRTGGPSRYFRIDETGGRIGFISPLTNNFCDGCNRVRLTCTGKLYMCLGQDDCIDFRELLRNEAPDHALDEAIDRAMRAKPQRHDFTIDRRGQNPAIARTMSVTGG
ncbi:MAG: GTP 3',8-cyclase MoaA [Pseudomonadota bacterium]